MSDYSITTDFAAKDSLSTGDANKIVKGTEITAELQAIRTAVNSKADSVSPTLTGTPLAPTASAGTSNTQIATTAFLATLYPVGTVYTNISNSTNPATLFGFGTWVAIAGRVIVGLDASDSAFDTAGETGGSKDAVVVSHTHTVTDPGHTHTAANYVASGTDINNGSGKNWSDAGTGSATTGISIDSSGVSGTNANLQPYVVAYVWKRTA